MLRPVPIVPHNLQLLLPRAGRPKVLLERIKFMAKIFIFELAIECYCKGSIPLRGIYS